MLTRASGLSWVALLTLTLSPSPALADEGEAIVALEPTWRIPERGGENAHGAGGLLDLWLGLNETTWLLFSGGATATVEDQGDPLSVEAALGLVAALDVLRAIPFAEASLGADHSDRRLAPFVRLGLGLDYLLTKTLSAGAAFRYRAVFDDERGSVLQLAVRIGWRLEL